MRERSRNERGIEQLPADERDAIESPLLAYRCGLSGLNEEEEEQAVLPASLDEAEREIDTGRVFSGDQLREALSTWAGK